MMVGSPQLGTVSNKPLVSHIELLKVKVPNVILTTSIDVLNEKRIKVIINGGALNPGGLAKKTQALVTEKGYDLKVAYVYGDDLRDEVKAELAKTNKLPQHLDGENNEISLQANATALLDTKGKPIVSANVYLGARGIVKGRSDELCSTHWLIFGRS